MGARSGRAGWAVPAAALVTLVWIELLRVWLPSVLFVVGDAGSTSAVTMGAFALATLAVPAVVATGLHRLPVGTVWLTSGLLLAAARAAILFTQGGLPQAAVSTLAVVAGGVAIAALAAGAASGHAARIGVLFGLLGSVVVHAALLTHDLVWDDRDVARIASLLLVAALLLTTVRFAGELSVDRELATDHGPGSGIANGRAPLGAAWPWTFLAPALLLVLVLSGVPGRVAVAAPGWSASWVVVTIVLFHGLAAVAALLAPRAGPIVASTTGAGLALVGTAGALQAAGIVAIAGQAATAIGLATIVGGLYAVQGRAGPRRRALVASGSLLVFGILAFAYYAVYDLQLPFNNRMVLLLAGLLAAGLGAAAGLSAPRSTVHPRIAPASLGRGLAAVVAIAALSGLTVPGTPQPEPATNDGTVRVALYNLHMGFDVDGRFSARELAAVLRAEQADVVVLNEVDRGWLTTGGHDLLQLVAADLGMPYRFAPAADEVWGNALLSRFPINEWSFGRLPRGDDAMDRSQFSAVLDVGDGRQLAVVGTHLSHGDRADTRLPQARAVAATVARLRERALPTVVLGDLNAERGGPVLATFGGLDMASAVPEVPTWPSWDPEVQIDHVLISRDLTAADASIPAVTASDHLPIAVTLHLPPDRP